MSIPPVASYLLFSNMFPLLPQDSAYHLPVVLWGIAGIGTLYIFLKQAVNGRAALLGLIFLALTPRYFADLHNNMKDIPSAVMFAVNMWLLWRLVRFKRPADLLFSVLAFAVAFNVKINSIFIPAVFAVWLLLLRLHKKELTKILPYFVFAPLAALALWSIFWADPIGQLRHAYMTFGIGTNNIEVLLHGAWYCSGTTVPWYYPFWYLAITTPIPLLFLLFVGICAKSKDSSLRNLFLLWLIIPLTRYALPNIGVIDGVRHFEEVLFPLTALAAIGADYILRKKHIPILISVGIVGWLAWNIIAFHPYQIVYFNEFVGGAKGAVGRYDLDYWGTSQKEAVAWVNEHAPRDARVHIVMAADVAGRYLREDLLKNLNTYGYDDSDFVIFLNRQSFFYRFFYSYEYLLHHVPAHTISVQGAPLVWIFDNRTENKTERQTPWWQGEDPCIIPYWRGQ